MNQFVVLLFNTGRCVSDGVRRSQKEVVQATLRNCNSCIASMLRSIITTVGRLVLVGTLIEKSLQAAKEYWQKQPSNPNSRKEKLKKRTLNLDMLNAPLAVVSVSLCFNAVTCRAVVD